MVIIREGGVERRVTADEAFLLHLSKRGLEGDGAAARATLAVIEEATEELSTDRGFISVIVRMIVAPGSVTSALAPLRMAKKLDPYRETARMVLEPWLVEAALARLDRRLSPADQRTIVKATRTPTRSNGRIGGANTPEPRSQYANGRLAPILLKKSEIERLRKSRECRMLAISVAERRCRTVTSAGGRFCVNRCGPSYRGA
jgi:hypothetical protein